MARMLTQTEFEHMLLALKKEVFDTRRFSVMTPNGEGKFQTFVESLGDFAYELNGRGIVCYANSAAEKVVCRPVKTIIGKAFLSLLKADCRTDGLDMLNRTLRGESTECELTFTSGRICRFKSEPMGDAYQKISGICGIARDVTEEKITEHALRQDNADLIERLEFITHELLTAHRQLAGGVKDSDYYDHLLDKKESMYCSVINDANVGLVEEKPFQQIKQFSPCDNKEKGTVLLVDDEDTVTTVGEVALRKLGYNVVIARSGQEAITIYRSQMELIDIVILDMAIPECGGEETYDELKQIDPDIKVLLCSAFSREESAEQLMARGCSGVILKPFNTTLMSKQLQQVMEK